MARKRKRKLRISKREKAWKQLKQKQKAKINEWMYRGYQEKYSEMILAGEEPEGYDQEILEEVVNSLNGTGTRLAKPELEKSYFKKKKKFFQKFLRERGLNENLESIPEMRVLGTGGAICQERYNTCFVLVDNGKHLLVDTGGGIELLKRLARAGIPAEEVKDVFISHKHMDHIFGVFWLIRAVGSKMLSFERKEELRIYGHDKVIEYIETVGKDLLEPKYVRLLGDKIKLIPVVDNETVRIMDHDFTFFDIQSEKEKQFGFTVTFDNGRKLAFLGDEPYRDRVAEHVKGSDWLLHDAYCEDSMEKQYQIHAHYHSTVKDACVNAVEVGAKTLVLYHTGELHGVRRRKIFLNEAKEYYKGKVLVPEDGERFPIN